MKQVMHCLVLRTSPGTSISTLLVVTYTWRQRKRQLLRFYHSVGVLPAYSGTGYGDVRYMTVKLGQVLREGNAA
jgi:hypothetical protein